MYVSTYNKKMPCDRGFQWSFRNGSFYKSMIISENISIASVEWIDYMNNDPRFVDKNGVRQWIQSGWGGMEVKIDQYAVDGFVEVDETIYALEFDGCHWVNNIYMYK